MGQTRWDRRLSRHAVVGGLGLVWVLGAVGCRPRPPQPGPQPAAPEATLTHSSARLSLADGDEVRERRMPAPGGAGQVPMGCDGKPLLVQIARPAPAGGLAVQVVSDIPAVAAPLRVVIPEGSRQAPIALRPGEAGRARVRVQVAGQRCSLPFDAPVGRDQPPTCPEAVIDVLTQQDATCAPCSRPQEAAPAWARAVEDNAWVCSKSEFFVEAGFESPTPCADFADRLRAALTTGPTNQTRPLLDAVCSWTDLPECGLAACGGDRLALPGGHRIDVQVTPVLPDAPDPWGHRRFFRVRFVLETPTGRRILDLDEAGICGALERVRGATDDVLKQMDVNDPACHPGLDLAQDPGRQVCDASPQAWVRVGQECPLRPTHVGAVATSEMRAWHQARLQGGPVAAPPADGPAVVLIDTGVDPAVAADLRVREVPVPGLNTAAHGPLSHGTAMALLIRQLAPRAPMFSLRAFGASGTTSTEALAKTLHHALYRLPGTGPLLVNLSLGWPGEFSLPWNPVGTTRRLRGGDWADAYCGARDDGVGEVVRYLLVRAATADPWDPPNRPVSVFAAAGNPPPVTDGDGRQRALRGRTCRDAPARVPQGLSGDVPPAWCDNDRQPRAPLPFLPGGWGLGGRAPVRWLGPGQPATTAACAPSKVVTAVGAVDALDRAVYPSHADFPLRLVAPGAQVYVESAQLPAVAEAGYCGATPPTRLESPSAWTGTSVSTALTTGLTAAAMAHWTPPAGTGVGRTPRQRWPSQAQIEGLLRATGERTTPDPTLVRPNLCRLTTALSGSRDCLAALGCALGGSGGLGSLRTPGCRGVPPVAGACALDATCGIPAAPPTDPPAWPTTYAPAACGALTQAGAIQPWTAACSGSGCLSAHEAGVVGPQPEDPLCPDCRVDLDGGFKARVRVELGLNPWTGFTLQAPRVLIKVSGGYKVLSFTGATTLKPGWLGSLDNIDLSTLSTDVSAWKASRAWFLADKVDQKTGARSLHFNDMLVTVKP